jgi:1,4-alpha-glucan branching enzyme
MIFRLADAAMYTDMHRDCHNDTIDRAIALHKMIRLYTIAGGGEAYLNFMGNEFGHPEWIDFPREGNGWSFHYCRRQWSLPDNQELKYQYLNAFDKDMIAITKEVDMFQQKMGDLRYNDSYRQVIAFYRKGLLFAFNFSPCNSYTDVKISIPNCADYEVTFTTDDWKYGGWGQIDHGTYPVQVDENGASTISLYLPARTAMVLREGEIRKPVAEVRSEVHVAEEKSAPVKKTAKKAARKPTSRKKQA